MATHMIARVNRTLRESGHGAYRLVKGDGYYYFSGPDTGAWRQTAVYVAHADDLTLTQWIAEFDRLRTER